MMTEARKPRRLFTPDQVLNNLDQMTRPDLEAAIYNLELGIPCDNFPKADALREQVRMVLVENSAPDNGKPEDHEKNQRPEPEKSQPQNSANGSNFEFSEEGHIPVQEMNEGLEQEAVSAEGAVAQLAQQQKRLMEEYSKTQNKIAETEKREKNSLFRMMGIIAGAQMERTIVDTETAVENTKGEAASAFLDGFSSFRTKSELKPATSNPKPIAEHSANGNHGDGKSLRED